MRAPNPTPLARRLRGPAAIVGGAAALFGLGACGEPFDRSSVLKGYRLLAVETPTPTAPPDGQVQLTAVDHDTEADRTATYTWTVCPFSFGANVAYECLIPETELTLPAGTDPSLTVDLATAAFGPHVGITAALRPVAVELSRQLAGFDEGAPPITAETLLAIGVDLWVKVESGPEGNRQSSVRSINVRYPQAQRCALTAPAGGIDPNTLVCAQDLEGDARAAARDEARSSSERYIATAQCCSPDNASPTLESFEIEGLDADGSVKGGAKVKLKVEPAADARQAFWLDNIDERCPNSDADAVVAGGPCVEELYYRFYVSGGEVDVGVGVESDSLKLRETEWTVPKEAGPVQLFVVVFDGRGGVTAYPKTVPVVAP